MLPEGIGGILVARDDGIHALYRQQAIEEVLRIFLARDLHLAEAERLPLLARRVVVLELEKRAAGVVRDNPPVVAQRPRDDACRAAGRLAKFAGELADPVLDFFVRDTQPEAHAFRHALGNPELVAIRLRGRGHKKRGAWILCGHGQRMSNRPLHDFLRPRQHGQIRNAGAPR